VGRHENYFFGPVGTKVGETGSLRNFKMILHRKPVLPRQGGGRGKGRARNVRPGSRIAEKGVLSALMACGGR